MIYVFPKYKFSFRQGLLEPKSLGIQPLLINIIYIHKQKQLILHKMPPRILCQAYVKRPTCEGTLPTWLYYAINGTSTPKTCTQLNNNGMSTQGTQ